MATTRDWLIEVGFKIPDLIAGFAGGVVNAFVFKRSEPWAIIGSVIVGALTANYMAESVAKYVGISNNTAAFLVGVGGMALVQVAVDVIKRRITRWNPPQSNGGSYD